MLKADHVASARPALGAALILSILTCGAGPAGAAGIPEARPDERTVSSQDAPVRDQLDPRARMSLLGLRRSDARATEFSAASPRLLRALILGSPTVSDLAAAGARVLGSGPGFVTVEVDGDHLVTLTQVHGIQRLQLSQPMKPELNVSRVAVGALSVHGSAAPPFPGFTGKNVVVGLVDTGLDWTHGDFRDLQGKTRIQWMWDQTDPGGPRPGLYPYGSEWSKANIETPGVCREVDTFGHGTHVAGIAAGNGAATGNGKPAYTYVGVAPEATIIAVKTDFSTTGIVDAVGWIFQKATLMGKDAVVNLSLGGNYGPHDGTDPQELALDALSGNGRIIVKSGGNTGEDRRHGRVEVAHGYTGTLTWNVSNYTASYSNYNYIDLDAFYQASESLTVTLLSPNGQVLGPVPVSYYTPQAVSTPDGAIYLENGIETTPSGLNHVFVEIWDPQVGQEPARGTWTLRVANARRTGSARFDGWLAGYNLGDGPGTAMMQTGWDVTTDITTPGNARKVITVGAYSTKGCWSALGYNNPVCYVVNPTYGSFASFSSQGPTLDGRLKPEISAPGFGVASARSGSASIGAGWTVDDGVHMIDQGTSMSCPHVTGAVALLFQKYPHMTPSEALSRLALGATHDAQTGATPNGMWGYGKLNVAGAMATPAAIVDAPGESPLHLRSSQAVVRSIARLSFAASRSGVATLRVLDVSGRVVRTLFQGMTDSGERELVWDTRDATGAVVASGAYWVELRQGGEAIRRRLLLIR